MAKQLRPAVAPPPPPPHAYLLHIKKSISAENLHGKQRSRRRSRRKGEELVFCGVYAFANFLQTSSPHEASVKFAVYNNQRKKHRRKQNPDSLKKWATEKRKYRKEVPAITDWGDAWNTTWLPPHLVSFKPSEQQRRRRQRQLHCKMAKELAKWEHFVCVAKKKTTTQVKQNERQPING